MSLLYNKPAHVKLFNHERTEQSSLQEMTEKILNNENINSSKLIRSD